MSAPSTVSPSAGSTSTQQRAAGARTGPLARRRSASKEHKQAQSSAKDLNSGAFNFEDEFGFDQNDEPTIRLPTKRAGTHSVQKSTVPEPTNPVIVQSISRENYSDPAVFDAVQELAGLQQKRKSLMEALNASRKQPPKPSRYVQKPTSIASKNVPQPTSHGLSHASGNKSGRPRKSSKNDYSSAFKTRTTPEQDKAQLTNTLSPDVSKADDLFCQQFLTSGGKTDTGFVLSVNSQPSHKDTNTGWSQGGFTSEPSRGVGAENTVSSRFNEPVKPSPTFASDKFASKVTFSSVQPSYQSNAIPSHTRAPTTAFSTFANLSSHIGSDSRSARESLSTSRSLTDVASTVQAPLLSDLNCSISSVNLSSGLVQAQKAPFPSEVEKSHHRGVLSRPEPHHGKSSDGWKQQKSSLAAVITSSATNTLMHSSAINHGATKKTDSYLTQTLYKNTDILNSFLADKSSHPTRSFTTTTSAAKFPESTITTTRALATSRILPQTSTLTSSMSNTFKAFSNTQHVITAPSSCISPALRSDTTIHSNILQPSPALTYTTLAAKASDSSNLPSHPPKPNMYYPGYNYLPNNQSFAERLKQMSILESETPLPGQQSTDPTMHITDILRLRQFYESQAALGKTSYGSIGSVGALTESSVLISSSLSASEPNAKESERSQVAKTFTPLPVTKTTFSNSQRDSISSLTMTAVTQPSVYQKQDKSAESLTSKTSSSETAKTTAAVIDFSVKSSSSSSISPAKVGLKASEPTSFSSKVDLKDKTYHGPKKKHILEKYSQQIQNPSFAKPTSLTKSNDVGLDISKSNKVGIAPGAVHEASKGSASASNNAAAKAVNNASEGQQKANKNEQSGSIFSLFDSLLQEATESAKDSLKSEPAKKKIDLPQISAESGTDSAKQTGKNSEVVTKQSESKAESTKKSSKSIKVVSKSTPTKSTSTKVSKPVSSTKPVTSLKTRAASKSAASSKAPAASSKALPASKAVAAVPVTTTSSDESLTTAVTRSPATFPFKRRHFQHAQNNPPSTVATTAAPISKSEVLQTPMLSASKPPKSTPLPVASTATSTVTSSSVTTSAISLPITTTTPYKSTVSPKSGLRLRITAFRSSGGQVIHQTTLLGDLVNASYESGDDDYYYKRKKKKKKKKKLKKKKHLAAIKNLLLPLNFKPFNKVESSDDINDSANVSLSELSDDSVVRTRSSQKKVQASYKLLTKAAENRNRDSSLSVDSEQDKEKKQGKTKKTKVVQRYKLKSSQASLQASSSDNSTTLSFHRQPGKPPLYLNAGANQTLLSGSNQGIPTIQLAPPRSSKSIIKVSSVSSVPVVKVPTIKLNSASIKPGQAFTVTKSSTGGVRYVLQTTTANGSLTPRVIVPKITPSTFPVGKATVFTVSSSGTRVQGTPKAQIQPTPYQSSNSSSISSSQPVIVKRVAVSLLPKAQRSISTSIDTTTTVSSAISSVVSFTSKPVTVSSKIIAPKPILATSKTSPLTKSSAELSSTQISIPTVTELPGQSGISSEKNEFQVRKTMINVYCIQDKLVRKWHLIRLLL